MKFPADPMIIQEPPPTILSMPPLVMETEEYSFVEGEIVTVVPLILSAPSTPVNMGSAARTADDPRRTVEASKDTAAAKKNNVRLGRLIIIL
jgi:hypothetical protein